MILNKQTEYGKVQFYFLLFATNRLDELPTAYMLVSMYSHPFQELLNKLSNTLWAFQYIGDNLCIVELFSIVACVSMQPLPWLPDDSPGLWFMAEKSGLEDFQLTEFEEPMENDLGELWKG